MALRQINLRYQDSKQSNARICRFLDRKRKEGYNYHQTVKTALELLIERENGERSKHLDINPMLMIKRGK
jgi:hypothetical protein